MGLLEFFKRMLKPAIKIGFSVFPPRVLEYVLAIKPSFIDYLPPSRKFRFDKYLGDITVYIDTVYPIERKMFTGEYDNEAGKVISKYVRKGDICIDIGANVGAISFILAKQVGCGGKVFACEPGSIIFNRLKNNIRLNQRYGQIICPVKAGFSDKREIRTWNEDLYNRGNAGFIIQEPNQEEEIELITLDEFCEFWGIKKVSFIKIDVEGMEYEVIKGGSVTINRDKPTLYYETGFFEEGFWAEKERGEKVILEIEKLLSGLGYDFYKVDEGVIRKTKYPDLSYNTLAMFHKS